MKNKRRVWQVSTARGERKDLRNLLNQIEDNDGNIADVMPWIYEWPTVPAADGPVSVQRTQCWDVVFWVWEKKTQPAKGRGRPH